MKIKLNVRVNFTKDGKVFTVWPESNRFLPGIEFYTGHGSSTNEAVEDLFARFPQEFTIDDEYAVRTSDLEYSFQRPFEIVRSDNIRIFCLR